MDSLRELMNQKANNLDVDAKRDEIAIIQEVIIRYFPEGAVAQKIFEDGGVLILVSSAALASELRLSSQRLIDECNSSLKDRRITKLASKLA